MLLTRNRTGPIAIDLGSYALRAIQLAGRDGATRVLAAACRVDPSAEHGEAPGRSTVVQALRDTLAQGRFVGKRVVSVLTEREVSVKNIRMPEMPEAELALAVRFEAIERIPGLDDDAEIRFLPAGLVPGAAESQQEVIVLAAPAATVRRHLEPFSELGLESVGIDAAPCAVFRPFERYLRRAQDQEQVNVFADIGWSGTRITITRGNRIAFTKAFDVGGARLDRLVAEDRSVDPAKARELRRQVAAERCESREPSSAPVDPATVEAVDAAVRAVAEQLGKEIGLCLRYYAVTFRGQRPDTITCVGGEALDTHFLVELSGVTGLPCRAGFPLRGLNCAGAFREGEDRRPMADWATVTGLSMKSVRCVTESVRR